MEEIDLKFGILKIFSDNVTAIEINSGVQVNKEDVIKVIEAAEKNTTGNYALISNRKKAYSTEITALYKVLSSRKRLKFAAIVAHRGLTSLMFDQEKTIERIVSNGTLPLQLFFKLEHAVERARQYLKGL